MLIKKRAIISGFLGASASFTAKIALSPDSPSPSLVQSICRESLLPFLSPHLTAIQGDDDLISYVCPSLSLATRGLCLMLMVGLNMLMISSFLVGMNESGSVVGTALTTAANFSCSAVYGILFFEEHVSLTWWFGASLIAVGMWLLSSVKLVGS
eukprot:g2193.t1 g2193   contig11:902095-902669(+)